MADINIGKAPPNHAVLPFYTTGAFAFVILCFLLLISAESLTGHFFHPHLLTIVHTAALGWGTMIIFGAAYQLLPVICERDLYSPGLAIASWYCLTPGVALLAGSFWNFTTGWFMIAGGALVVLATLMYAINVIGTSRICSRYSIQRLFIVTSACWLLFTVVVGLLLAINLSFPFFSKNHLDILKLHAHAGLAGWFLLLIVGVSTKLVPMFLLGKSDKNKLLMAAFLLQNTGLIAFLADGYFGAGHSMRIGLYALLILAGVICWLRYLADAFRNRVRKKTDYLMKHTFISFLMLLLAFGALPLVLFQQDIRWVMLYGTLLFMGWISGIILGMTFKTLPFIVWNGHYKHLSGKMKVPLPKQLYRESLVNIQFYCSLAAIVLLTAGVIVQYVLLIRIALAVWCVVGLIYLYNVIKVLRHKTTVLS